MRILKWLSALIVILFIAIQFYPISLPKNSFNNDLLLNESFKNNAKAGEILNKSCFDCHSNRVNYPWYSHIAPVSWVMKNHIMEGRKELNFSEWSGYTKIRQIRKLNDIQEQIKTEMPPNYYTIIHRQSKLSKNEKEIIANWCNSFTSNLLSGNTAQAN